MSAGQMDPALSEKAVKRFGGHSDDRAARVAPGRNLHDSFTVPNSIAAIPSGIPSRRVCLKEAMTSEPPNGLLGHNDVKTTMTYSHVPKRGPAGVCSPVEGL